MSRYKTTASIAAKKKKAARKEAVKKVAKKVAYYTAIAAALCIGFDYSTAIAAVSAFAIVKEVK